MLYEVITLRGIYGIGNQFAQKDFVIRIEKLFNNGENVLGSYSYFSGLHSVII